MMKIAGDTLLYHVSGLIEYMGCTQTLDMTKV